MSEENTPNTENQDTDESGVKLGKFKSPEELLAAYEQAERERQDLKESLDREQRLNQLLDSAKEPEYESEQSEPGVHYAPLNNYFDEDQIKVLDQYIAAREQSMYQKFNHLTEKKLSDYEAKRYATERFYQLYPDLKDFSDMVDANARALGGELGDRAKAVSFDKLAEEIASRTKKQLAETHRKLNKSPLYVESGAMSEPTLKKTDNTPKETSEEDRLAAYMKEEASALAEKKSRSFRAT